jgi:hypothetical protein
VNRRIINSIVCILIWAWSCSAYASDLHTYFDLPIYSKQYTDISKKYQLASTDEGNKDNQDFTEKVVLPVEFKPKLFTVSKIHQYFGLGTVLFMGLTVLSAPDTNCEQNNCNTTQPRETFGTTHTRLARTTAKLAIATVATGLIAHWDDFYVGDGLGDPDNMHVMLGTAGALLLLSAVHKSATSTTPTSHAAMAELGGAAMLVAIKLTW